MRPWFWEIKQRGSGPHYFLVLDFTTHGATLGSAITPLLADYQPFDGLEGTFIHNGGGELVYTRVEVQDFQLVITRGWGNDELEEDAFIQPVLLSPALTLMQWRVMAGGEGYATQDFHRGNDVSSFFQYCRGGA